MTKRYYWLKLKTDFFQQRELKKLRKIAGGDTYTIIYLKMLLLAIQHEDCIITYDVDENKFVEELSLDIDEEPENVIITLSFLKANKMADFGPSDMLLTQANELIGSETEYAVQKRKQRANQNLLKKTTAGQLLDNVQDNVLTEKEKEKEIDKEKYIKESGQTSDICPVKTKKEKPIRHAYGEYKNVYLTDTELEKLQAEFPVDWKRRIETMSGWLAANGRCYKNYLAALRNWAKRDNNNKTNPLVQEHKKKDFNIYWEEAVRRKKDLTNVGWSHPVVYNLAKKIQWNEKNLDFERTLFMVGLNEYDAQHPNEL